MILAFRTASTCTRPNPTRPYRPRHDSRKTLMPAMLKGLKERYPRARRLLAIVACTPLLGPAGCDRTAAKAPPAKPPVVMYGEPVTREVTDYEEFVGQTTAAQTVEIRARVNGYL